MNKISIDSENIILNENRTYYLTIENDKNLIISINEDIKCKLVIVGYSNYNINYVLNENSNLVVNSLNYNINSNITIDLESNTNLVYNYSIVNEKDSFVDISINHLGNSSSSEINNNGINLNDNKLYFTINGCIAKKLSNINCSQNSKIINYKNGNSKIIPNLIIDSNDINANHSAYIGNFDKEIKFYMASRGIDEQVMQNLLYKSILLGKMNLNDEEEDFKKIINEWRGIYES